jgi:hypothetical protein
MAEEEKIERTKRGPCKKIKNTLKSKRARELSNS